MSADEKKVAVLPESVRARDRGGLFIPKLCFLPFISIVIETVCQYANREAYKKYGRNLLKVRDQCQYKHNLSRRTRKPTICICENKDADQLRGNC